MFVLYNMFNQDYFDKICTLQICHISDETEWWRETD